MKLSHVLFKFAVPDGTTRGDPELGAQSGAPSPRARLRRRWARLLRIDETDFQDTEPSVHDRYRVEKNDRAA